MRDKIAKLLDIFNTENPYADSLELAQFFFQKGKEAVIEEEAERRRKEDALPRFYGD